MVEPHPEDQAERISATLVPAWALALPAWAGRAVQGAVGAFVITGSLASLSLSYPEPLMRARAFSLLGVIAGAAMALGPTLGGVLASWLGWHAIFLVSLPVCPVISLVVPRLVPETREPNGRPLHGTGLVLFTGALLALVQALLHVRCSPLMRSAFVILSAMLCIAFLRRQRRRVRPMLDPSLIARREPLGLAGLLLALSVGYWAVLVYVPSYFAAAYGLNTTDAGLAMLAATVPMLVLPPAGARMARRWGWRRTFASGLLILAIGTAALPAASHLELPLPAAIVAIGLATIGAGLINPQASGALIATAPPARPAWRPASPRSCAKAGSRSASGSSAPLSDRAKRRRCVHPGLGGCGTRRHDGCRRDPRPATAGPAKHWPTYGSRSPAMI